MKKLELSTIDEALSAILNDLKSPKKSSEVLPLSSACGRVCSRDVRSSINVPGFRRSTVDGYAVMSSSFKTDESKNTFRIIGKIEMGQIPEMTLSESDTVYVPTGGAIPSNCDAVVMLEYASESSNEAGSLVHLSFTPNPGDNFVEANEDISIGELIIERGAVLSPSHLGKAVSAGIKEIEVYSRPKVSIISTGNELAEITTPLDELTQGKVYDMNSTTISALCSKFGYEIADAAFLKDDLETIRTYVESVLNKSDIIIFSGGSSVGEKDYISEVVRSFEDSRVLIHGIRVKPGKPTMIANIQDKIILGLPGHPGAAYMIFNHFGRIIASEKLNTIRRDFRLKATLSADVRKAFDRDELVLLKLNEDTSSGELYASPVFGKSAVISKIAESDGYFLLKVSDGSLSKGQEVLVHRLI